MRPRLALETSSGPFLGRLTRLGSARPVLSRWNWLDSAPTSFLSTLVSFFIFHSLQELERKNRETQGNSRKERKSGPHFLFPHKEGSRSRTWSHAELWGGDRWSQLRPLKRKDNGALCFTIAWSAARRFLACFRLLSLHTSRESLRSRGLLVMPFRRCSTVYVAMLSFQ